MRPGVLRAIAVGWLLCLVLLVVPFQVETRLVGLGGVVLFAAMYVAERRLPRSHGRGEPGSRPRRGHPVLPFLAHDSARR